MLTKTKELIKNWAENTTFHEISSIVGQNYLVVKVFWFLSFLTALALALYTIINEFVKYYSNEVLTTVELVDATLMPFPAVTVCNLNPFATFDAVDFVSIGINSSILAMLNTQYFSAAQKLKASKRAELLRKNVNDTFRRSMGLDISSFVKLCLYNGKQCNLFEDFEWSYDSEMGNCYTFTNARNETPKTISKIGPSNGLIISLFVGLPKSILTLDFFSGAYVFLHLPTSKPIQEKGIQVASGFSNMISFKKLVYRRLDFFNIF